MTGLTAEQAAVALTPLQLNVVLIDKSSEVAGGAMSGTTSSTSEKSVVDQNPKAGTNLPPNGTVTVYIDVKR
jgi:beta-lactam-binding protein with PASTA domain